MALVLKVVQLLEPELCRECRFADVALVKQEDGTNARMIYCKRLDCDNWGAVEQDKVSVVSERNG